MRFRAFGRTGLQVSAMGFGCWPMAGDRYGSIEEQEAVAAVRRAFDLGVNCFDTAPAYDRAIQRRCSRVPSASAARTSFWSRNVASLQWGDELPAGS